VAAEGKRSAEMGRERQKGELIIHLNLVGGTDSFVEMRARTMGKEKRPMPGSGHKEG